MKISPLILIALLAPGAMEAADAGPVPASRPVSQASAVNGSAPETYTLGPADVLQVFVWKEPELSTAATVRPDGRITLPLAGELQAAGRSVRDLEEEIAERLRRYLDLPVVTVMVQAINSPKIAVLGEVRRPGRYLIPQRTTVLDAIALGGGFTEYAHRDRVVVLRSTPRGVERIRVDVRRLVRDGGDPVVLEPGDTVHVD